MSSSPAVGVKQSVGSWQLLRQNRRFRWLFISQLISSGGDWFNSVAILGLVLQLTNSGLATSLVLICSTIPQFFLTPFVGSVVDRFDRRKLMIASNAFSTVAALLFLLVRDGSMLWLLYVSCILLIASASFFGPASAASVPNIVSEDELFTANALSGATWSIMLMVGSALGGIVSTLFGRDIAFVINSLSFLIAGIIIATIEIPSPKAEHAMAPWQDFKEGLAYLHSYLPALAMALVEMGWGLAIGVVALLTVFAYQVFHAGDAGIGALYAARGFGVLVGSLVIPRFVGTDVRKGRNAIWRFFLIAGIGYIVFAGSGALNALWLGCIGLFMAHFGGGVVGTISSVMLQQTTPDRFRGRVFSVTYGLSTLATGLSTLGFGVALQGNMSPMVLALFGASIFILYGIVWGIATAGGRLHISEQTVAAMPVLRQ